MQDEIDGYQSRQREAIGESEAFLDFQDRLSRVGPVDRPVLIIGERGTGKELAARAIHFLSGRWQEPLVELNCAALSPSLIESELFGHEAGAFTGATGKRTGRFEAADGGTLFLDELGNIPIQVQEKILRVVEYGTFERVGGSGSIRVDVRIVAATNANLVQLASEGRFMRDLLDRLSFDVIYVPPLRERREDILLLANHFAVRMAAELDRPGVPEFSEQVIAALEAHPWRGNVRELKNVIERAVYQNPGALIDTLTFDPFQPPWALLDEPSPPRTPDRAAPDRPPATVAPKSLPDAVADLEIRMLREALSAEKDHQGRAAKRLGLSYHQFRGLYKKHKDRLEG
ncbi:MAG: phage shock protein operon transcriptional activator [Candidatus Hydrogenedens sp.]|nr:phage shock protein operon transcriptional activator [Candidatus Hydrogenedens sp.]